MSKRASAVRYARALLDIAIKESDPEAAGRDLAAFAELVQSHLELQRALANPVVSVAAKREIVREILERLRPCPPVAKLLLLLADRGRLELVPDVFAVYQERLMEHRQILQAEITTAAPLAPERAAQLRERLAAITGRTVTVTAKVDQGIIGGVVTRIGSTVYDGSVATQLARFRDRLAERNRA